MGESHFVNYHTFNCENKEFRNSMNKFLKATDFHYTKQRSMQDPKNGLFFAKIFNGGEILLTIKAVNCFHKKPPVYMR